MKKVLVTGGLGFVGSNLVDKLISLNNYEVYVVDNLSSKSSSLKYKNPKASYFEEDIRDFKTDLKFDLIFHLAGLARIQPSFSDPLEYLDVNILGTAKLCELTKKSNAKLIYASSSSINNGEYKTPYTFSKWGGEEVLKTWSECYGIESSICRFYNVYGPREPKIGDYATVVRKFIRQYRNNKPLTIVGDGEQRRDFTHVSDIVDGLVKVSEKNSNLGIFHLGRGINYSINQLANMFGDPLVEYVSLRRGEGEVTLADYEETFNELGWRAVHNLEDWIIEQKND